MQAACNALIKYGGKHSHADIAEIIGVPYSRVRKAWESLKARGIHVSTTCKKLEKGMFR